MGEEAQTCLGNSGGDISKRGESDHASESDQDIEYESDEGIEGESEETVPDETDVIEVVAGSPSGSMILPGQFPGYRISRFLLVPLIL